MCATVPDVLSDLKDLVRTRFDPLGFVRGDNGSFSTGHVPQVAPHAYLCTCFAGLDDYGVLAAEGECGRRVGKSYKEALLVMNGAWFMGVSLHGCVDLRAAGSLKGGGLPISISYQNTIERPSYIPAGHLGIGAINGDRFSQGHLYLTETGEVELYNALFDMIGMRWKTLASFLSEEIPRQMELYDKEGSRIKGGKFLPGDTEDWEGLARRQSAIL